MTAKSALERELKLGVPSGFSLARLPKNLKNFVAEPAQFLRLHTVYYDTDDLRLARWGCSLRFRQGEGWMLKIPVLDARGEALSRMENHFDGPVDRVPPQALELAAAFLRGVAVRRVAELRTLRVKRDFVVDGFPVAEVVEDDVRVLDGTRIAQRFAQLEIELAADGAPDALDSIASALRDEGAGGPDPTPKNARALAVEGEPEIRIPLVDCNSTIGDVVRAALGSALVQYMRCDPLLRSTDDVEAVHKARVAIRKLRSHFHSFIPVLDEAWAREMRGTLKWLQDALAPVRAADVFAERMHELAASLPESDRNAAKELLGTLDADCAGTRAELRARLRQPQYFALLDEMIGAIREPRFVTSEARPAQDCAHAVVQHAFKRVRKAVRSSGDDPTDRELHQIRIKAKHLRYVAEAFAPVLGKRATKYAARVEKLQEVLGTAHDAVVAVDRLRAADGNASFAAGELAALAAAGGDESRRTWRKIWRPVAKKKKRFW